MAAPVAPEPLCSGSHEFIEKRLPFLVVGGVGVVFFVIGLFVSWNAIAFMLRATRAEGLVTGVETVDDSSDSRRSRTLYYPLVEFTDAAGETHSFRGDVSRSSSDSGTFRRSGWSEGDRVAVRYDPSNPDDARLAGGWSILPHLFIVLGAGAICAAWFAAPRATKRAT